MVILNLIKNRGTQRETDRDTETGKPTERDIGKGDRKQREAHTEKGKRDVQFTTSLVPRPVPAQQQQRLETCWKYKFSPPSTLT